MKNIQRHLIFVIMVGICVILWNQIVFMKYGITLSTYLKYSSGITEKERDYLKFHSPIRLGSDITAPPISYYDETTEKYTGLIVDYANFLSIETEAPITISMYTFYDLVEALRKEEIDVCDVFPSENRAKEFDLSIPIYRLKTVVISPKKGSNILKPVELAGKKVAVPKGDLAAEYITNLLKKEKKETVEFVPVNDTKTVLELLQQGVVDAAVGDEVVVSTYWKEYDVYETQKYNVILLYEKDVVLAVNKDSDLLLSILNKGILQTKKNHIVPKVQQKWFGISESIRGEKRDLESFINIAIILFICLISLYAWNYFLKKSVLQKTREIEEKKENISMILNNLDIALFIINETCMVIECNRASLILLSQKRKDVIEKSLFEFSFLSELLELSKYPQWKMNLSLKFRNIIKSKCYEIKLSPYISREEKLRILSIEDITEKLIIERKLHQENKMITIGQISAGLAHEIRNPLGIIRNGLYLIKMKISSKPQKKAINMMENSIQRINNLIEHLLRFSRTASDKCIQENIETMVSNIMTFMETKLKAKKINYHISLKGNPVVTLNTEAVNIILINLIENAIDAFSVDKEDNLIQISISSTENSLDFLIEDNGVGILEEGLPYIFDPFYTTKEGHGTGLGLYLVYNEIKKYNGDISVESQYGIGTKFFISIHF
ncbi:transporter substrate-binding domain-containing protein [Fusobacterium sp.]|uniref:transporter substrate-binding domain-containing protein n=1 Tax=Fusobacterium sp. TaxID=68766 RepID=UPI002902BEC2|nr:transporter substrate-binding domain-containing protein [Fusobacterium sp.]MDU1912235.1 transporter substrate-binding domain-containing protein [Fusobacterium sp.]